MGCVKLWFEPNTPCFKALGLGPSGREVQRIQGLVITRLVAFRQKLLENSSQC